MPVGETPLVLPIALYSPLFWEAESLPHPTSPNPPPTPSVSFGDSVAFWGGIEDFEVGSSDFEPMPTL